MELCTHANKSTKNHPNHSPMVRQVRLLTGHASLNKQKGSSVIFSNTYTFIWLKMALLWTLNNSNRHYTVLYVNPSVPSVFLLWKGWKFSLICRPYSFRSWCWALLVRQTRWWTPSSMLLQCSQVRIGAHRTSARALIARAVQWGSGGFITDLFIIHGWIFFVSQYFVLQFFTLFLLFCLKSNK